MNRALEVKILLPQACCWSLGLCSISVDITSVVHLGKRHSGFPSQCIFWKHYFHYAKILNFRCCPPFPHPTPPPPPRVPGMCWWALDCSSLFSLSLSDASIVEAVCWQQISFYISLPVKFLGPCDKAVSCEAGGGRGQHSCKVSDCSRGRRSLAGISRRNCREWVLPSMGEKCRSSGVHQTKNLSFFS